MLISEATVSRELLLSKLVALRIKADGDLPQSGDEVSNREEGTCAYLSFFSLRFDGVGFAVEK
jgi:hypothetical protein